MFEIFRQIWEPGKVTVIRIPSKHATYADAQKAFRQFHETATTTYQIREMKNGA